jgi:hypothetical protein
VNKTEGVRRCNDPMPTIRLERRLAIASIVALAWACRSGPESKPQAPPPSAAELAKSLGLEVLPHVADGVPIRVVDAASGKPVGGALVVSVDETEFTYSDAGDGGVKYNARSLLVDSGQAYATSSDGLARVAAPEEPRSVFVWRGEDFGRTTLEVYDHAEHVVTVAPRALTVEVVDKNGKPQAGVPIQLGKCALEPMAIGTTVGVTGPDGRFAIPALELERAVHRSCGRRALVMLGYLVSGFELRAIDAPRLEPVKFVLPDCGDVEIDFATSHPWPPGDDAAAWPRFSLSVWGSKRGDRCGLDRQFQIDSEREMVLPIDRPPYRLEHVEVGTRFGFHLGVQLSESTSTGENLVVLGDGGLAASVVDGPSHAGEVEHLLLKSASLGAPLADWSSHDEPNPEMEQILDQEREKEREKERVREEKLREQMSVASSIDVSVLLDVAIEPCWLSARLDDNQKPNESDSCPWIDVNGRATMRGIPAGKHSVTITARRMSNDYADVPLCRIDDVEVGPSQHLRDPRLLNIDLRGKLRVHRYEITDGDGHPLTGFVRFTREGDREFADDIWFKDGHVAFLTGVDDGVRASVAVSRFRKQALDLTSSEPAGAPRRVFLERGIGVHLRLERNLELPSAPHDTIYVGVSEMPHWCETLDDLRTVPLRADADLDFRLAEPGDWKVIFLRSHDDGNGETTVTECNPVETTISVRDSDRVDSVQWIDVKPDADHWKELLASLGEGG